jgi:CRISPR-associated protein Cas2
MVARTLYIAAYDVRDPKRLRKALLVLKKYSTGGQKSVFECYLTEAERSQLLAEVDEVLDPAADRFLFTPVDSRREVKVLGCAVPPSDPPFYYIG